jgi:hypothetical protein
MGKQSEADFSPLLAVESSRVVRGMKDGMKFILSFQSRSVKLMLQSHDYLSGEAKPFK